jgi:hypothetical protein
MSPITDLYTKRFNNLTIDSYKKKIYEKMEKNYLESIAPNTYLINREYRPVQNAYMVSIKNKEKKIINENLEKSIEGFTVKSYKNILIFIVIILIYLIFKNIF